MEQELKEEVQETQETQEAGQTDQAEETQKAQKQADEEIKARESGWLPKEEYRGKPDKWSAAKDWNDRAERVMPIMKAILKETKEELAATKAELATLKSTTERVVTVAEKYSTDAYQAKLDEIRALELQAVNDANVEEFNRLQAQKDKLVKPEPIKEPVTPKPEPPKVHPAYTDFVTKNSSWFGRDQKMTQYAEFVADRLAKTKDPVSLPGKQDDFFRKVTEEVQATFPQHFRNPNRDRQDLDETPFRGGGDDSSSNNGRDWNHLPPDAKAACAQLMKDFPGYTQEQYLETYPWGGR